MIVVLSGLSIVMSASRIGTARMGNDVALETQQKGHCEQGQAFQHSKHPHSGMNNCGYDHSKGDDGVSHHTWLGDSWFGIDGLRHHHRVKNVVFAAIIQMPAIALPPAKGFRKPTRRTEGQVLKVSPNSTVEQ